MYIKSLSFECCLHLKIGRFMRPKAGKLTIALMCSLNESFHFLFAGNCVNRQVSRKDEKLIGFGLVEFARPTDAEETLERVQGYVLDSFKLTLRYCIPGQLAPEAYNKHLEFLVGFLPFL